MEIDFSLDPYGLAGQWLTDALNASVYTYEVAPVFTLMEDALIKEVCRMVGPSWHDGIFCPGGSTANGMAINLARFNKFNCVKVRNKYSILGKLYNVCILVKILAKK